MRARRPMPMQTVGLRSVSGRRFRLKEDLSQLQDR